MGGAFVAALRVLFADSSGDTLQSRHGPDAAQVEIECAHPVEPRQPFVATPDQRVLEHCQQGHRREMLDRSLGERQHQRPRRRRLERLPRRIVDRDAPARQMRRDPAREATVGSDQRPGAALGLEDAAQRERGDLRLLVGGARGDGTDLREGFRLDTAPPVAGKGREAHGPRHLAAAQRRAVGSGGRGPVGDLAARHRHAVEQAFERELRVRLVAAARVDAERVPLVVGHRGVEARQHDAPVRQPRDHPEQAGQRRRRDGDAGGDDQP